MACLTEHARRGYTHIIWDPHPWNLEENGMTFSIAQAIIWAIENVTGAVSQVPRARVPDDMRSRASRAP